MFSVTRLISTFLFILFAHTAVAQTIRGMIVDSVSREPVAGATVKTTGGKQIMSGSKGQFQIQCEIDDSITVSFIGYTTVKIPASKDMTIALVQSETILQAVVVSAGRGEATKRSNAPIAIESISSKTIQDVKPTSVDQLLNRVSGVNMVNLGNEQHQMSIRQPMTTKSLFLYLEDGIPVRTTGLFNHNAILEMNMVAVKNIEIIKGPSSALYGSEAIGGVVNFITQAPTMNTVLKLSAQKNNIGLSRGDLQTSFTAGKWGFSIAGYYSDKKNGYLEYSDFHKGIISARIDYRFSEKTSLSTSITALNYNSDMSGGIDSTMFANKSFKNLQTFTYRSVQSLRARTTLNHNWTEDSKTSVSLIFRQNNIEQNPAYRIKDDYRKQGNVFVGRKDLAHGETNESSFNSYAMAVQHRQRFNWKDAVLTGGLQVDISPSSYQANYIRINKDTVSKKYVSYKSTDSGLTRYNTNLNNYSGNINFELSPIKNLRIVGSLRYDIFRYGFDNHLKPSSFSGSADTVNYFKRISPKIGFTYNFSNRTGLYANYSEGFVPPQVTEMYTGVKVPKLNASIFYNYEIGGWAEIIKSILSADISLYSLQGTNEIISVRLDDGSFANQNAGRTSHKGIEAGVNLTPFRELSARFSGAYSKHRFVNFLEKGTSYNGNEMNNAPNYLYNTEVWYKPSFLLGVRIGAEWQHVGSYYVNPQNTAKYAGYDVFNLRAGYRFKGLEVWMNVLNVTDKYYSYITSKGASGYSYQLAEPRNFTVGVSYDFGGLIKKTK